MKTLDPFALPLSGTTLIEASAGTGKTYTITTLYLRLLLESGLGVGRILVVTFTNAATAELRSRIRRRLREAADALQQTRGSEDETIAALLRQRGEGQRSADHARLLDALYGFDEAAIFTIHGFCQRMLQENAFESGVSFDAELIADENVLRNQVVHDFWVRQLHAAPAALVQYVSKQKGFERLHRLAHVVMNDPRTPILPRFESLPDAASEENLKVQFLRLQLQFVAYARAELRRRKDASNVRSFDDLLYRLNEALQGPHGAVLAERIRQRFGAALIDEFQDTDPVQYEIFRRVYHDTGCPLFLIGDPKQAIFAFRGADVFTYLNARRDAGANLHTLRTNWRSGPRLVRAVNTVFTARAAFALEEIEFQPAVAASNAIDALHDPSRKLPPLQFLFVPRRQPVALGAKGWIKSDWANRRLSAALAADIVRLLRSDTRLGERNIQPADIAVLCNTNVYAVQMQEALRALGVPTALQGDASVLDSGEAEELGRVLAAVAEPADARSLRAALAGTLLGLTGEDLVRLEEDETEWDVWAQRFYRWHDLWEQRGFMPAFRRLLEEQAVLPRLLARMDGERRLTNLLHLGELLHVAATNERRGPLALVDWLRQMRTQPLARRDLGGETAQIRLESDERALKLVTIHKSKGLQYPIVFCPQLWHQPRRDELTVFHELSAERPLTVDLGSPEIAKHEDTARHEALAERLRLLYVALTRAQHCCVVVWGKFSGCESSALGYIVHQAPGDDGPGLAERTRRRISGLADDAMIGDLLRLEAAADGAIGVRELSHEPEEPYAASGPGAEPLTCRTPGRRLRSTWRTSSFSGLAATATPAATPTEEGLDRDALGEDAEETSGEARPAALSPVLLADFPAGTRAGQLLHEIFEHMDFQTAAGEPLRALVAAQLERHGFDSRWVEPVRLALAAVLDTPLEEGASSFTLRQVPLSARLNEMEFVFPVSSFDCGDGRMTGEAPAVTPEMLATAFAAHAQPPLSGEYAAQLRRLGFRPLAGYLKGFVDLVFHHGGRWYVVDYKSNRLGTEATDYGQRQMLPAMTQHHYFLQYHLYVVALHRYLTARLPGYDYERHFGAVLYLFLRGMSPERPDHGVFRDRPPRALIEALSELMRAPGAAVNR